MGYWMVLTNDAGSGPETIWSGLILITHQQVKTAWVESVNVEKLGCHQSSHHSLPQHSAAHLQQSLKRVIYVMLLECSFQLTTQMTFL